MRAMIAAICMTSVSLLITSCGGGGSDGNDGASSQIASEYVTASLVGSAVELSWKAIQGADSYRLYWDTSPDVTTADHVVVLGNVVSATHTPIDIGKRYSYRVAAVIEGKEAPLSKEVTVSANLPWRWNNPRPFGSANVLELLWNEQQFVAVGGNGIIVTSPNGQNWTEQTSGSSEFLTDVVWTGDKYVVVGSAGSILLSVDGIKWESISSGSTASLDAIEQLGTKLIALGDNSVLTSEDGYSWSIHSNTQIKSISDMATNGSRVIAVTGEGKILASSNGTDWSLTAQVASGSANSVIWSGSHFLVTTDIGAILSSADGITWATNETGVSQVKDVSVKGSALVGIGTNIAISSSNGSVWTIHSATQHWLTNIACNSTICIASGEGLFRTTDGVNWTPVSENAIDSPRDALLVDVISDGQRLVAVGNKGNIGLILTSDDGNIWVRRFPNLSVDLLYSVASSGTRLVAVGRNGTVVTSQDGYSWTSVTITDPISGDTIRGDFSAVIWLGNKFLVSGSGVIAQSLDGVSWTTYNTSQTPRRIAWNGATIAGVTGTGDIFTSIDGINWTLRSSGAQPLRDITWTGTMFVAVGDAGAVLTSPDGLSWLMNDSGITSNLGTILWNGQKLIAMSGMQLYISTDGTSWDSKYVNNYYLWDITSTSSHMFGVGFYGEVVSMPNI